MGSSDDVGACFVRTHMDYNLNAFSLFGTDEALMEMLALREIDLGSS